MRERKPAGGLKSEETEEKILTAALDLFRERGFAETTMRDIAARADVATGAAYYYFASKDAIVMAFYERAAQQMQEDLEEILAASSDLRRRLRGLIEAKLTYFEPSRRLLSALAAHVDPANPLSPFSDATSEIREKDVAVFEQAVESGNVRVPEDLKAALPRILWLYQMGVILFWIHDQSAGQKRTTVLVEKSVAVVVRLIRFSSLPLMRPLRKQVLELYAAVAA